MNSIFDSDILTFVMSTKSEVDVKCQCGQTFKATVWQSVNATASPNLCQMILDGAMNMVTCPSCGMRFHVEIPFLYHDLEGREWIWVYPVEYQKESFQLYSKVHKMWEEIKQSMPPNIRRRFEKEYKVTILFGMDALVYYLKSKVAGQPRSDKQGDSEGNSPDDDRSGNQ
ncbi:MAG: CpXC domain-containing protein [bacterium]